MPDVHVEALDDETARQAATAILQQLWTEVDAATVRSWLDDEAYHPFGLYADGDLVAVAGCSIQRVLHHVRHVWIHDLVVDRDHRSQGYGARLLAFVEEWGREHDCEYVALALRSRNDDARRFYEKNGMTEWGSVIERAL